MVKMGIFERYVAFTGDKYNTNFGDVSHKKGNNVFWKLKEDQPDLVGVGSPAHITNNWIHYGANQPTTDVEGIILGVPTF